MHIRTPRWSSILAVAVVSAAPAARSRAASYNWSRLAGGTYNWNSAANWGGGGSPNAVADVANLGVGLTGDVFINVPDSVAPASVTIGQFVLGGIGLPVTTDLGNSNAGAGTIILDNTGVGNATITSGGVAGAINRISAPMQLSSALDLTAASTNGITLNALTAVGANRTINNNLPSGLTVTLKGIINLTEAGALAARGITLAAANGTTPSYVIDSASIVQNGGFTGGALTIGNTSGGAAPINITINSANTHTGVTQLNKGTLAIGNDSALGAGVFQGGGQSAFYQRNIVSTDDARTIANQFNINANFTFVGSHSLTFTGAMYQGNSRILVNNISSDKTLTFAGGVGICSAGDTARTLTLDGSGRTILSGPIYNHRKPALGFAGDAADDTTATGAIVKSGTGQITFTGTASTYKGTTTVNGGILEFNAASAYGATSAITVNAGGAVGELDGSTGAAFRAKLVASAVANTGALALAPADANVDLDFTGAGNLSDPKVAGMSIGATIGLTPVSINYTGTITPAGNNYRLGGGGTLVLSNANALTGAGRSLTATNGGTVALTNSNDYDGPTIVTGSYILPGQAQAALSNGQTDLNTASAAVRVNTTLQVSKLDNGSVPSSIGKSTADASNLLLNGATLIYSGAGDSTDRLFTISANGATLDSSGAGAVNFTNTASIVQSDAPDRAATVAATRTVSGVSDTSDLAVGMVVSVASGTGTVPVGATITGMTPTSIILSGNTTAGSPVLHFGNQNRSLNLAGSNGGDNVITPILANSASGLLAVNKTGSGKWILNGANTYTGGTSVSNGLLVTNSNFSNGTLTVSGGTAQVAHRPTNGQTAGVTKVTSLSVSGTGRLDLTNNGLILDYTGASPLAQIRTALTSGYNGNTWTGTGITSSDAAAVAASAAPNKTAVGYAEASQIGSPATFLGVAVDADSVLVRYTLFGDANLSGNVDSLDFNALAANFGTSGKDWVQGNFNYDPAGVVDSLDFNALAANFGQTLPAAAANALGSVVPEPTSLGLIALAGLTGLTRRRRAC